MKKIKVFYHIGMEFEDMWQGCVYNINTKKVSIEGLHIINSYEIHWKDEYEQKVRAQNEHQFVAYQNNKPVFCCEIEV